MPHNYTDIYSRLSNTDILETINNPGDYDVLAVKAAKEEWDKRNLSAEDIEITKQIFNKRISVKTKIDERLALGIVKEKYSKYPLVQKWQAIRETNLLGFAFLTALSLVLFILCVMSLNLIFGSGFFRGVSFSSLDFYFFLQILLSILNLIALLLFIFLKRSSWFFLFFNFSFSLASGLFQTGYFFTEKNVNPFIPTPSVYMLLIQALVPLGLIAILSHKALRHIFSIKKKQMFIAASMGISLEIIFENFNPHPDSVIISLIIICITGIWMRFTEKYVIRKPLLNTAVIDANLFDKEDTRSFTSAPEETHDAEYLFRLLTAKKKDRMFILQILDELCPSLLSPNELHDYFRQNHNADIIQMLMNMSSSYKAIKENVHVFVEAGIIEKEYPHKRI